MIFEGLRSYGYNEVASEMAAKLRAMLEKDIMENDCLHEYYDPETGKGLTHPGFINWNTCALLMN
jgi:putative isomerase